MLRYSKMSNTYLKFCFRLTSSNWITDATRLRFRMKNVYQIKSTGKNKKKEAAKTYDLDIVLDLNQEINSEATLISSTKKWKLTKNTSPITRRSTATSSTARLFRFCSYSRRLLINSNNSMAS